MCRFGMSAPHTREQGEHISSLLSILKSGPVPVFTEPTLQFIFTLRPQLAILSPWVWSPWKKSHGHWTFAATVANDEKMWDRPSAEMCCQQLQIVLFPFLPAQRPVSVPCQKGGKYFSLFQYQLSATVYSHLCVMMTHFLYQNHKQNKISSWRQSESLTGRSTCCSGSGSKCARANYWTLSCY